MTRFTEQNLASLNDFISEMRNRVRFETRVGKTISKDTAAQIQKAIDTLSAVLKSGQPADELGRGRAAAVAAARRANDNGDLWREGWWGDDWRLMIAADRERLARADDESREAREFLAGVIEARRAASEPARSVGTDLYSHPLYSNPLWGE